jgi:hypothetical protein
MTIKYNPELFNPMNHVGEEFTFYRINSPLARKMKSNVGKHIYKYVFIAIVNNQLRFMVLGKETYEANSINGMGALHEHSITISFVEGRFKKIDFEPTGNMLKLTDLEKEHLQLIYDDCGEDELERHVKEFSEKFEYQAA